MTFCRSRSFGSTPLGGASRITWRERKSSAKGNIRVYARYAVNVVYGPLLERSTALIAERGGVEPAAMTREGNGRFLEYPTRQAGSVGIVQNQPIKRKARRSLLLFPLLLSPRVARGEKERKRDSGSAPYVGWA